MTRREDGFTLIELTIVIAIIGVLVVMGLATYRAFSDRVEDRHAQLDLVTAAKVQALNHLETGSFSDDAGTLRALEPNLLYSADGADGTVVVVIEEGQDAADVCLFRQSGSGTWFGIHHSSSGGDRYAESEPIECTVANTAGWATESW